MFAATNRYMILPYFASLAMRSNSQEMLALHHDLFLGEKTTQKSDMMTDDMIWSLPPENGLLRRGDSKSHLFFRFQLFKQSVFVGIASILIRPGKDSRKDGHGRPLMQMVIKYQIMM